MRAHALFRRIDRKLQFPTARRWGRARRDAWIPPLHWGEKVSSVCRRDLHRRERRGAGREAAYAACMTPAASAAGPQSLPSQVRSNTDSEMAHVSKLPPR